MYAQIDSTLTTLLTLTLVLCVSYALVLLGNVYRHRRLHSLTLSPFSHRCRAAVLRGVMAGRYQLWLLALSVLLGAIFQSYGMTSTAILCVIHGAIAVLFYSTVYVLACSLKRYGEDVVIDPLYS